MKKGPILHAEINTRDGSQCVPVENENAAVQASLLRDALSFQTVSFEIDGIEGALTQSSPESAMRYVGVEKLYTLYDIAGAFKEMAVRPVSEDLSSFEKGKFKRMSDEFNEAAILCGIMNIDEAKFVRNMRFDELLPSYTSFIALKDGMKAFDKQGQQIWPKVQP